MDVVPREQRLGNGYGQHSHLEMIREIYEQNDRAHIFIDLERSRVNQIDAKDFSRAKDGSRTSPGCRVDHSR